MLLRLCFLASIGVLSCCAREIGIHASAKLDPGLRDVFAAHGEELERKGGEEMENLKVFPNDASAPGAQGEPLVRATDPDHPAATHLVGLEASWTLGQRKRNFVFLVEDMENGYSQWVDYVVPGVSRLLDVFRAQKLPVIWTNWVRRSTDGLYNGVDRFYGPQGIAAGVNPAYMYGDNATHTMDAVKPITEKEESRVIQSLHLNKFADLDEEGREILFPMLRAWGVNTLVLAGAWTDDCIAATAFDAVDRYGLDLVLVTDGLATATIHGHKMVDVLCAAVAKCHTAEEIAEHLESHPELTEKPKDRLHGDVYKNAAHRSPHAEL